MHTFKKLRRPNSVIFSNPQTCYRSSNTGWVLRLIIGIWLALGVSSTVQAQWKQLGNSISNSGGSGDIEDRSGMAVSLSADGQTLAVSAPEYSIGRGQVRVYKLVGGIWTPQGNFITGGVVNDNTGTSISLSADGLTLAVGAYGYNSQRGQVKVYQLISGVWTQQGNAITGVGEGDFVGVAVSLSADGQTLAVGAPRVNSTGQTKVYQLVGREWLQQGSAISGDVAYDYSGGRISLSSDGQTLAVSALSNNANRGQVKVFKRVGGVLVQQGSAITGDAPEDQVGASVSLSANGQIFAVGASASGSNAGRGQVKVYQLIGGVWTQQGSAITGNAQYDYVGVSVSLSSDGQTLAVGASGVNSVSGEVRVYKLVNGTWTQKGIVLAGEAPRDQFGASVKLSSDGQIVVVGAPGAIIYRGSSAPEKVYQFCDLSVSITPDSPSITAGTSLTLTATGGSSYTWSNSQTTSAITVSLITTTTYSVTAVSGVCSATASITVTVLPEYYTVKSGDWTDPTVWSVNKVPTSTDVVQLKHSLLIPDNTSVQAFRIGYDPGVTLQYGTSAQLLLQP